MSNLLDKQIVVKLNKHWIAYEIVTVRSAMTFLCSEAKDKPSKGRKPGFAIDFETITDEAGNISLVYQNIVSLEDWLQLPVRDCDLSIGVGINPATGQPRMVRVPLVVICANYNEIPQKNPKRSREAILERDGYTCQYSGKKLPKSELNLDHVIPRDRGGRDTWENLVACERGLNSRKGNRLNSEIGLKLIRKPKAPNPTVRVLKAEDAKHPSQVPFLLK